jgi:hypothetical protein
METYIITASSLEEYRKADLDPCYAPKDCLVAEFEAEHYRAALKEFRRSCARRPDWYQPQLSIQQ